MKLILKVILPMLFTTAFASTSFGSFECMPNALSYAVTDLNNKIQLGQLNAYSRELGEPTVLNLNGYIVNSEVKVSDHNKDTYSVEFELKDPYRRLPTIALEASLHGLNPMTNNCKVENLVITYRY